MGKNSKKDIVELRKELLKNKLIMLGYEPELKNGEPTGKMSQKANDDLNLRFLGRLGKRLEFFERDEKNASFEDLQARDEAEKALIENQNELLSRIRSEYPDYCMNMKDKVTPEEWEIYSRVTSTIGELFKGLNSDIDKSATKHYGILSGRMLDDIISPIIDSTSFARACAIEDAFVKEEGERFVEKAKERDYENETVKNTQPALALAELVRDVEATGREKEQYLKAYGKYKTFIESKSEFVEIRGKGTGGKKEYE